MMDEQVDKCFDKILKDLQEMRNKSCLRSMVKLFPRMLYKVMVDLSYMWTFLKAYVGSKQNLL